MLDAPAVPLFPQVHARAGGVLHHLQRCLCVCRSGMNLRICTGTRRTVSGRLRWTGIDLVQSPRSASMIRGVNAGRGYRIQSRRKRQSGCRGIMDGVLAGMRSDHDRSSAGRPVLGNDTSPPRMRFLRHATQKPVRQGSAASWCRTTSFAWRTMVPLHEDAARLPVIEGASSHRSCTRCRRERRMCRVPAAGCGHQL